jgi:hypothetical protein
MQNQRQHTIVRSVLPENMALTKERELHQHVKVVQQEDMETIRGQLKPQAAFCVQ